MRFKQIKNIDDTIQKINEDGTICCVPVDEQNSDYKEYLRMVAEEGYVIEPADEPQGE